jgi:hypothetical protein
MGHVSFHIHKDPGRGAWVVEEEASHQIGGIFVSLGGALAFVEAEARRFHNPQTVVELSKPIQ